MKTYTKHSLTLEAARQMIDAAIEQAINLEMAISVVVIDESGLVKASAFMDGTALIGRDAALKKAKTAAGFGMSTGADWLNFIKDDPILTGGVDSLSDFTLLGGGLPVIVDGHLVGAIGVSGGHYTQDEQCARAGVDALN